uniref:Uncharacterized protein n=1 Tax=viral metagenome TaxID=1070528 RepID=A0A6C0KTL8_9ZZZZ
MKIIHKPLKKTAMNQKLKFEFKSLMFLLFCSSLFYTLYKDSNPLVSSFVGCFLGGALWFFLISNWQMLLLIVLISLFNALLGSIVRLLYVY